MKIRVCKILGIVIIAIFALSATSLVHAVPTLSTSSTISNIKGSMAYDSGKNELLVLDSSGEVSIIPDSSNKVTATVATGFAFGSAY